MSDKSGRKSYLSKDYLIQKLQEAEKVLGRVPDAEDFKSWEGFPDYVTYRDKFGSWKEVLRVAGYEEVRQFQDEFELGRWTMLRWNSRIRRLKFGGVYVLYLRNEAVYIGSGSPVGGRMSSDNHSCYHLFRREDVEIKVRRNRKRFEHLTIEARLIYRLKPRFNVRGKY